MEGPRVVLFILLLLFIFLSPEQPQQRRQYFNADSINLERVQDFEILTNSSYGDFDVSNGRRLNLTGFREDDGYQWNLLPDVQELSRQQFKREWFGLEDQSQHDRAGLEHVPTYADISGEVRGKFTRSELSSNIIPHINLTELDPKKEYLLNFFQRNITEAEGEITLSIFDTTPQTPRTATSIKADIAIWSESAPGNGWQGNLVGVHFPSGSAILSTFSSKFNSLPVLPHFALDQNEFDMSRSIMNKTVTKLWEKRSDEVPDLLTATPSCELVVWLQPNRALRDLTLEQSRKYLHQVEEELNHPEGAPIGQPPPMTFSAVVLSPDCGYVLEAQAIFGPKVEAYWKLAERLLMAFIIVLCLQITLLKRQMERAATPSTRSRISYYGIVIVALGDGLILFAMIALLMLDEAGFLVVAAAAYLACIHVAFLEVKFVFDIWTVQVGDPARAELDRQRRAAPPPAPATSADGTVGLPLPASTPRTDGATPVILPADQDIGQEEPPSVRASFAAIYSRFYFTLVCLMFFSLWAISWPRGIRSAYANLLALCYLSFWWPQIYRNTMRNCRKALTWEYVVGSSLLRTVPVLYWYFAERNILAVDTSPSTAFLLLGWVWLQVGILASQQFLGPRLLVKDSWCPPAYDYHPVLQEDDAEAGGMSIGLLASASEAKDKDDKTRKVFDCAICMNEINVPVLSRDEGATRGTTWLEQRNYMVTPCRHIFHAECLEGWMNLRLVCPVCRETLPPL